MALLLGRWVPVPFGDLYYHECQLDVAQVSVRSSWRQSVWEPATGSSMSRSLAAQFTAGSDTVRLLR